MWRAGERVQIFYRLVQNGGIVLKMKAVGARKLGGGETVGRGQVGRPRCFDTHVALDAALQVFWKKGYEGTSLSDLTRAMGIERPSLYATFGNKEELFRKVLDRYACTVSEFATDALNQPTARAVVERLLMGNVEAIADPHSPAGCLLVSAALSGGDESEPIRRELNLRRRAAETALRKRLQRAKVEGDLPAEADPGDLASYVLTVAHGMAVRAKSGARRAELRRVAQTALRAWPT
jgi:AcrR family transcriptional regulator